MDVLEAGVVPVAENVESLQVEVQRLPIIRGNRLERTSGLYG